MSGIRLFQIEVNGAYFKRGAKKNPNAAPEVLKFTIPGTGA